MANKKKTTSKKTAAVAPQPINDQRPRKLKLALGILGLLVGIFICLAIVSYCVSWRADQDKVLTSGLSNFILHDHTPVANWGGRLGAALAHVFVFKGVGIAALAIGLWIAAFGLNILYGKKVVPVLRYMRWLSIVLLVLAPVMTYLFPHTSFAWGGAWGNVSIDYLNGLVGKAGTGMLLLSVAAFFAFVVFALDIRPLLQRAKRTANKVTSAIAPTPVNEEMPNEIVPPVKGERIRSTVMPEVDVPQPVTEKDWDMGLVEKPATGAAKGGTAMALANVHEDEDAPEIAQHEIPFDIEEPHEEDEETDISEADMLTEEEKEYQAYLATKNGSTVILNHDIPAKKTQPKQEFSFEVITQPDEAPAAPAIEHGGHISIEDGEPYAPELDLPNYKFPTLDLLEDRTNEVIQLDKEELEKNKNQIINTLRSFGIEIQRISATVGPTVTLYEIVPAEGVRISKIRNLEDDIALNLAALGIRIIAPIPGRGTIGIEVPNANKQIVSMRALLSSEKFVNTKMSLPIALGKKIDNENYIVDLATMPHLLMAGATGQGKSVGINAILVSLLYKKHPSQLKFVMVDPKKVELSIYRLIEKHFLAKLPNEEEAIITDTKKVIYTLNALCIEMDNRYELLKEAGTRNIKEYNEKFISRRLNPERGHKYLPFIVLVVDEFADLIMTAGKEVEVPIARLAQLARAVGIHLIIATQRPSVNVITGTIKANFPARMAFKVSAKVDSRTILDTGGAEQLVGRGDMLVSHGSELLRLQCAFVDTPEVEHIVEFIGKQRGYPSAFELPEYEGDDDDSKDKVVDLVNRDKLFEDCARLVVQSQNGSTSNLQRRFNLGYNRAGRIMDQLEAAGIVGPAMGSKPRDVLFHTDGELEQFLETLG
ncbi:FtsK/SpoIIIE family DNA translocase [Taibaiella soli]|uniref:DNA translocase FtsK n=1 Tax=Taibaiella soli TaxID=1649169 RepID=A0A2W2AZK3_9BACT|nr:DNA translocase FtsK [Taibaiella soli]PZF73464.1 DNA translocase FtsK [Taibaiella soli]